MIQRIQTVLLGIASLLILSMLFGIAKYTTVDKQIALNAFGVYENVLNPNGELPVKTQATYPVLILIIVVVGVFTYTMLEYKNRKRQILLCNLNNVAIIVLILALAYYHNSVTQMYSVGFSLDNIKITFPFLAMVLNMVAKNRIQKDEDLVKSADRLR